MSRKCTSMKKLLDLNFWIALSLETHPQHDRARAWYEQTPLRLGDLLFCRQTEMGFLRLITQERTMTHCGVKALSNAAAIDFLEEICRDPAVARAEEPSATRSLWWKLAHRPQASPNVWMDAYLAALAISSKVEMVTFDQGFKDYQAHGLRLVLL
jgi:uncharacterized protein